jgi:hypothetical protein
LQAERFRQPHAPVLRPQRLRTEQVPEVAEGVEVVFADLQPVAEADAELVGAVGGAQELGFVDADDLVVLADGRKGSLADADAADDLDAGAAFQPGDQGGGRHPAGAAAADNDDAVKFL